MNPKPRGKIVQKCKILSVSRNCDLSLKLESTLRDESKGMFVSQNEALEMHNRIFTQNSIRVLTSKNELFNEDSFRNSEATMRFVVSR